MDTFDSNCVIVVKVPDMDYLSGIESKASEIIQGLKPGQDYNVIVKSGDQEPDYCRTYAEKTIIFKGEDKKTTEYVIRDVNGQLDAVKISHMAHLGGFMAGAFVYCGRRRPWCLKAFVGIFVVIIIYAAVWPTESDEQSKDQTKHIAREMFEAPMQEVLQD